MVPVENRSRETLLPLIQYIAPTSIIISDFWKSYENISDFGYTHRKVNHSVSFTNDSGEHTNTIEGLWRHFKKSVPHYNRRKLFFNGYVQKFIFLRFCRANKKNKFVEFLKMAGKMYDPQEEIKLDENFAAMAQEEILEESENDSDSGPD